MQKTALRKTRKPKLKASGLWMQAIDDVLLSAYRKFAKDRAAVTAAKRVLGFTPWPASADQPA